MRRLFVVMLFALLVLPCAAFAQDQPLAWTLNADTYLDVKDLGFRFYYPAGWVYGTDNQNGIGIADSQANLDAQNDGNNSTQPTGLSILIRGIPLTSLTDLDPKPTLEAIADYVVKVGGITETQRAEIPIMTRRSISIFGTTNNNRAGIASLWVQNGYLIVASLGAPDVMTLNTLAYTWGATLSLITPLDAQALSKDMLSDETSHFTINYPADWTPDPNKPAVIYEKADEVGQGVGNAKGELFGFSDVALSDLKLQDDAKLDDVIANVKAIFDLDDSATREEFVLLDQPAITLSGEPTANSGGAGHGLIVTVAQLDQRVVLLFLVAPSKDAADSFMPTWVAMLSSIKPT